ncbi:MAG: hypothetical protein E7675_04005 [Ruminococcaceae bacterium]|nr:hypothetical protein [Oscillospiraceae bacterium]
MKGNYLIKDANYINVKKGKLELVNIFFSNEDGGKKKVTISKTNKFGPLTDGTVINDLGGNYIAPAFCDIRCNIGDVMEQKSCPDTLCAKEGGYGIICPTPPRNRNYPETPSLFNDYKNKLMTLTGPTVLPVSPVIRAGYAAKKYCEIEDLVSRGFKLFTDRSPVGYMDRVALRNVMSLIAKGDGLLICSAHDTAPYENGAVNEGRASAFTSLPGIPPSAELLSVMRNIILSAETGCRIHISGISLAQSVKMIRNAKADGVKVTCSVAPPYFCYKEDELLYRGAMAKLMPPLRSARDIEEITKGLCDGTIDCIESDHMPVSSASKKNIQNGAFGSMSFETAFSAGLTYLVKQDKLNIFRLIELMSVRPFEIIFNKVFDDNDLFATGMVRLDVFDGNIYSNRSSLVSGRASIFDGAFLYGKAHRII